DWTGRGVKALTLFFYGTPGNDVTEQMYMAVEDGSENIHVVRYGDMGEDMNDITVERWHQWDIALSDFNDNGVTITDVNKVRIGFGDRVSPVLGGTGVVYFDDIRLYLPKCVPWLAKPAADFSNNCIVDLADAAIMAGQWLRTDANLPVETPTTGPVGWWELDEGTGTDVSDSSGYNNHGTLEGDYSWISGRIGSNALEFGNGKILVPDGGSAPELRPASQISVCAWVNFYVDQGHSSRLVVKGYDVDDQENFALQIEDLDGGGFFIRDANSVLYGVDFGAGLWPNEWIHLAATYDANAMCAYVNGQLVDKDTIGAAPLLQNDGPLAIGDAVDVVRNYRGKVDDVRVYGYALSETRVAYIATEGAGYVPLASEANLHDTEAKYERAINFRDYALLMDSWLEEVLWPQY
ncbi:MAG: LamG domain-containing protein, partial [Planctomycetota bacterium]